MNAFFLCLQGIYPEVAIDVDVPSGEDDVIKKLTSDDARDGGASLAELIAPSPIRSDASGQIDPFVTYWIASTAPLVGECRHKRSSPIPKQKCALTSLDQVMIQIELPSYREPCSPLDLVAIEIIFERLFEAFQHISQDAGTGTSADADIQPQKKTRHVTEPPQK
jgi:hypothetical protein